MPKFNSCLLPDTGHSCSLTPFPYSTGCFRILRTTPHSTGCFRILRTTPHSTGCFRIPRTTPHSTGGFRILRTTPHSTGCFRIFRTTPHSTGCFRIFRATKKNTVEPIKQWNRRTPFKQSDVYLLFLIKENSSSWKKSTFWGKRAAIVSVEVNISIYCYSADIRIHI